MHAAFEAVNRLITLLNTVSPEWYILAAAPLANIAQHFLKKERDYSRGQNRAIAIGLAALAGAFYGVLHTPAGAGLQTQVITWLSDTALLGSPIGLTAYALYRAVSKKLEERHELLLNAAGDPVEILPQPESPVVETVTVHHATTVDGVSAAPQSAVDADGNVII